MEPITLIVTALALGAAAGLKSTAEEAIKDAYTGLKTLLIQKFSQKVDIENVLTYFEKRPSSENLQGLLKEELINAQAAQVQEIVVQAQALLDLLKKQGYLSNTTYDAIVTGSGAIAQGPNAVAAGAGGIAIGGSMQGSVYTSDHSLKSREETGK